MFQIAGGSVGLGLTTTVFIEAGDTASGADSFIDGIEAAFKLDAGLAVIGFLICLFLVGGRAEAPVPPPPRGPHAARARAMSASVSWDKVGRTLIG